MYQLISTDGKTIFTEEVRYIKQNPTSGAYVEATEDDAQGVAVGGVPYGLMGRAALSGATATVSLSVLTDEEAAKAKADVERNLKIDDHKVYLAATDYIILKIAEAQAEGDTEGVTALQTTYADELARRKEARAAINELEAEVSPVTDDGR